MSEIKNKLTVLLKGQPYLPLDGDVVIHKSHSLADILRYVQDQAGGTPDDLREEVALYFIAVVGEEP